MQYILCEMLWGAFPASSWNYGVHDPARDPPPGSRERESSRKCDCADRLVSIPATQLGLVKSYLRYPAWRLIKTKRDQMYHTLFPIISLQQKLNTEEDKDYFSYIYVRGSEFYDDLWREWLVLRRVTCLNLLNFRLLSSIHGWNISSCVCSLRVLVLCLCAISKVLCANY